MLFVGSILLVVGLAVILHGFLILQEVDEGGKHWTWNQAIRERAYTEFAIGIIPAVVGLLVWYFYGRSPGSKHI